MKTLPTLALSVAALSLGACTSTGNTERNAAGGAALGAAAGAVIGNNVGDGDAGRGAAIGAAVGGVAGAVRGQSQDRAQEREGYGGVAQNRQYYDEVAGRYYTVDPRTGDTYWENGQLRSRGSAY
ncbi:YMGG-like glycine zipper-containing protein [Parvularcula dongshanensis]|uniref:Uncharacterized protein YcfJ n=1 Tax=Parvularcula dongshanensis TaxID=1173995 RepID=A0A840I301_9PROT|nr:glycine zipper domain-containing protein [Parvularcula dongshanensis]MBB4658661.1 uncharacterized protein YcfJ [Parvularcula dongshanensis]